MRGAADGEGSCVSASGEERNADKAELHQVRREARLSLADPLARYLCEAQPLHDLLRRGLIQLSGFLLKRTIAGSRAIVDYSPVEAARERICEAAEGLTSLGAPTSAAHHRGHLIAALSALQSALAAALSPTDKEGDALFHFVEEAERHLRAVGRATPGFETVDFRQACCAMHGGVAAFEARFAS
jgi:hypothetical protein